MIILRQKEYSIKEEVKNAGIAIGGLTGMTLGSIGTGNLEKAIRSRIEYNKINPQEEIDRLEKQKDEYKSKKDRLEKDSEYMKKFKQAVKKRDSRYKEVESDLANENSERFDESEYDRIDRDFDKEVGIDNPESLSSHINHNEKEINDWKINSKKKRKELAKARGEYASKASIISGGILGGTLGAIGTAKAGRAIHKVLKKKG